MKKCTTVLFFLALSFNLLAQPTTITWQGKLLDASGNAITQNNVAMTFAMFDASTGGNQLWPSSGAVVKVLNVLNGLYSVPLGTGTGDDIAFTAAMFNGKTPWLEVKVGTETLPRTEITNVPFALISNDLSAEGWENPGEIGKTTPNTGKFTTVETGSVKITTGASTGKVLTSDSEGNTSWGNTSLLNFEDDNFIFDSKSGVTLQPKNPASDVDLVLSTTGKGALLVSQPDSSATGGYKRGKNAIDFQMYREVADQVASGEFSLLAGGMGNKATGLSSAVVGGGCKFFIEPGNTYVINGNTASGTSSFVGGGISNSAAGNNSFIAGGSFNTANSKNSLVGGVNNTAESCYETIFGLSSTLVTGNSDHFVATDRLFTVGNGSDGNRSNALSILKNANTTIGGSLTINGNGTDASISLPTGRGTSGQVLKTDGSGNTNWTTSYPIITDEQSFTNTVATGYSTLVSITVQSTGKYLLSVFCDYQTSVNTVITTVKQGATLLTGSTNTSVNTGPVYVSISMVINLTSTNDIIIEGIQTAGGNLPIDCYGKYVLTKISD